MRALEQENDIEVLREFGRVLIKHVERIEQDNKRLRALTVEDGQRLLNFDEQLKLIRRQKFKKGPEKRAHASDRPRDNEQTEILIHGKNPFPPPKDEGKEIPIEICYHDLTDVELREESKLRGLENPGGDQWEEVDGLFDTSTEITVLERSYKKIIHKRKKRKLKKEFNTSDKEIIITADGPLKLFPGSKYSIEFMAAVVSDKYVMHLPLERQTKAMNSLGLKGMRTSTLSNVCTVVAAALEPLQEKIRLEVINGKLALHCDETPWPIQIKEQDNGYMWIMSNRLGSYYCFEPTRSGEVIKEKIKGFEGVTVTDGYTAYNRLKVFDKITQAFCWAHVRRKFTDIESDYPETKGILDDIDRLFAVEREGKTFEELKILRDLKSKPLVEKIKSWLYEHHPKSRGESTLRNAIQYTLKLWHGLVVFLEDVGVPLSNNEAERTIRHSVVGRKNYYGSRNHNGADTAATMFTVIESCKKIELDPRTYILMALKILAQGDLPPTPLEYVRQKRS